MAFPHRSPMVLVVRLVFSVVEEGQMRKRYWQSRDYGVQETYWQQGIGDVDEEYGGPKMFLDSAESNLLHRETRNQDVRDPRQEYLTHGPSEDHEHASYIDILISILQSILIPLVYSWWVTMTSVTGTLTK